MNDLTSIEALQRSLRFQLQSVVFGQAVERGIGADIDGGEYQRAVSKDADPFAVGVDKCVHGCNTVSEQIHSSIKAAAAADGGTACGYAACRVAGDRADAAVSARAVSGCLC